jgi:hypothetical protein
MTLLSRRCMCVLWPSFLAAALLEMAVFAFVSPADVSWGQEQLGPNPVAVYTIAFFVFWLISAVSSALTVALSLGREELNHARP